MDLSPDDLRKAMLDTLENGIDSIADRNGTQFKVGTRERTDDSLLLVPLLPKTYEPAAAFRFTVIVEQVAI